MEDDRLVVGETSPFKQFIQQGIEVFHGNTDRRQAFVEQYRRAVLLLGRQFDDADESAGPWFDGQLAQSLYDMFGGTK